MIPNKPTSSPLTLPITTKTSSTTGCNGSDKPEVHKIIGHSSQDKLFAELLAAGKVKRVPENGSFAVTESNNENVILTNTEFLPESILKDPNSIIAGKSIYTILKKILSTIKFDPIVNIGSKRTESFKFQTNGGLLVNIKKIDQFYITGSYIWKLLSTNSESLNLIFKDLFATQSDSTSSFISAAFKNTQFCAGLATEIDIRVDTKTPNEELNSFLSSKLRDVVEKEYQKEVTKFSRFNGSTLVGFKTCNSHIEVFFTGEYDNPISSLSSFYLCLKFNENKDNFEIVFPKNPHYDRMDLFVAMGCLINIPNLNNPVPAFCRCMRDNSVTAEGYLEHLIKILFNKDSQQDQDNALKAVSILETVLQKNITFNGDLEKDYEHQKIFSLIWNTLQNLIHHEVINENSAQKILSRLQDLESFKAIEQKPLMKILTTQQGKYTISELFSAVEILTFLYFPSSATIRQKPLQYVVEKGLNIKFAANLKRSLEKIYSLYCRDKASTLIPDLLDLFCQSAGKELAIDQKFYDFILTNLSDKLTADEVLECATNFFEHENAHISLLGANLILICLKFSKPDSKKIPSQIVTKVLTYIPLNSSLLNLFYLNITKFLNIVPDCNINLSSYDFWLDLFLSNSLTQEASNIWEQNKTLFHKDAPKNIYTTANFQSDQIPALQFAIKFYQEINISPDGLLSVLKKNRSNLKLVFKKYPEQLINYIQSAKKDYKDALELLLYIDNDSYIFKFILSQKLDLNEIPLETKQKVPAVVNMLSDLDLLKLELGQKLQGLIVDCIDSVKLAHLNLVISYYSPFYQLSAIDLEVEICDEVLKKLNSISDALAQHYKIKCLQFISIRDLANNKIEFTNHKTDLLNQLLRSALLNKNFEARLISAIGNNLISLYSLKIDKLSQSQYINPIIWAKIMGQTLQLKNIEIAEQIAYLSSDENQKKKALLILFQAISSIDNIAAATKFFIHLHHTSILSHKDSINIACLKILLSKSSPDLTEEFKTICKNVYMASDEETQKKLEQYSSCFKEFAPSIPHILENDADLQTQFHELSAKEVKQLIVRSISAAIKQKFPNSRFINKLFIKLLDHDRDKNLCESIIKVIVSSKYALDLCDQNLVSALKLITPELLNNEKLGQKIDLWLTTKLDSTFEASDSLNDIILALPAKTISYTSLIKYALSARNTNLIGEIVDKLLEAADSSFKDEVLIQLIKDNFSHKIDQKNSVKVINCLNNHPVQPTTGYINFIIQNNLLKSISRDKLLDILRIASEIVAFDHCIWDICAAFLMPSSTKTPKDNEFKISCGKIITKMIAHFPDINKKTFFDFIDKVETGPYNQVINYKYLSFLNALIKQHPSITVYEQLYKRLISCDNLLSTRKKSDECCQIALNIIKDDPKEYSLDIAIDLIEKLEYLDDYLPDICNVVVGKNLKNFEKVIDDFLRKGALYNHEFKSLYLKAYQYLIKSKNFEFPMYWLFYAYPSFKFLNEKQQIEFHDIIKYFLFQKLNEKKIKDLISILSIEIGDLTSLIHNCGETSKILTEKIKSTKISAGPLPTEAQLLDNETLLNKMRESIQLFSKQQKNVIPIISVAIQAIYNQRSTIKVENIARFLQLVMKFKYTTYYKETTIEIKKYLTILIDHIIAAPSDKQTDFKELYDILGEQSLQLFATEILYLDNPNHLKFYADNLTAFIKLNETKEKIDLEVLAETIRQYSLHSKNFDEQSHIKYLAKFMNLVYLYYYSEMSTIRDTNIDKIDPKATQNILICLCLIFAGDPSKGGSLLNNFSNAFTIFRENINKDLYTNEYQLDVVGMFTKQIIDTLSYLLQPLKMNSPLYVSEAKAELTPIYVKVIELINSLEGLICEDLTNRGWAAIAQCNENIGSLVQIKNSHGINDESTSKRYVESQQIFFQTQYANATKLKQNLHDEFIKIMSKTCKKSSTSTYAEMAYYIAELLICNDELKINDFETLAKKFLELQSENLENLKKFREDLAKNQLGKSFLACTKSELMIQLIDGHLK